MGIWDEFFNKAKSLFGTEERKKVLLINFLYFFYKEKYSF